MYKKYRKFIVATGLIIIFSCPVAHLLAQQDPAEKARSILDARGELLLEIFPADTALLPELNQILSIDRRTEKGYEVYANKRGFSSFLQYDIPYRIIHTQPTLKSATSQAIFPGEWDSYPSYMQYSNFMLDMAEEYPGICRLDSLGESVAGRKLLVMKISDNPGSREAEPAFYYTATMHGDELPGYVLTLRLIEYLCENYKSDTLVTRLVDNLEIWINPLANPDGTYYAGGDSITSPKRFNLNEVDLNRNFPGIEGSVNPDINPRQPENIAQMDFIRSIYLVMAANIHSGEEVVNYPFDTWEPLHADDFWFRTVSREYASSAQERSFPTSYMAGLDSGITNGWKWYKVAGSRQDWVTYYNHAREVTLELSIDKSPPPGDLPYYWHWNYPAMLRFMEQSLFGIHGLVRDMDTGEPLKAQIWVKGHDKLNSHIYSDSLTGFFARPISPGFWQLEVSHPGYHTELVQSVLAKDGHTTWLDINLAPLQTKLSQGSTGAWSPYFSGRNLVFQVEVPGRHHISLYDTRGSLLFQESRTCKARGKYLLPVDDSGIPGGICLVRIISPGGIHSSRVYRDQ